KNRTPHERIHQRRLADAGFSSNKEDLTLSSEHFLKAGSHPRQSFFAAHNGLKRNHRIHGGTRRRRMPRLRGRSGFGNRTDEPIASAMCGFNKAGVLQIVVVERFPKLTYDDLQRAVVDKSAWPDSLDEFLFRHEEPGTAKKIVEQREY